MKERKQRRLSEKISSDIKKAKEKYELSLSKFGENSVITQKFKREYEKLL